MLCKHESGVRLSVGPPNFTRKFMYLGLFTDKANVAAEFQISLEELEDCKILFAAYDNEDYQGDALVIFAKDGKLYEASGSHCSCYGLEGQWNPEETFLEALKMRSYRCEGMQHDLSKFLVDFMFEEEVLKN